MPRPINFDGRQVVEPGVYNQVRGLVPTPVASGSYGNVMIIDTGSGKGFGGGAGINGELANGGQAVYEIPDAAAFKKFVRGGLLWDLVDYLMAPATNAGRPATLFYARAAATVAAKATISFGSGAGSVVIGALNEGDCGNGVLVNGALTVGYGWKPRAGVSDPAKFIVDFYEGQFRGLDADGIPYDGVYDTTIKSKVVCSSAEFANATQFITWANKDANFKNIFKLVSNTPSTTAIINSFLTNNTTIAQFLGGTTSYSLGDLDDLLAQIIDLDNSLFLLDDYGIIPANITGPDVIAGVNKGALSTFNNKILAHVLNDATYTQKALYMGGGQDSSEYSRVGTGDGTEEIAAYYDSPLVHVIHSAIKVPKTLGNTGQGYKYLPSLYTAAMVCGRVAGLLPQTPVTYKDLRIIGVKHELKKAQRERALTKGVLHIRKVKNLGWVVNKGINTKQVNDNEVYNDGTSPEISIMRIIHQLNKELKDGATIRFVGGNKITASLEEIIKFTQDFLQDRTGDRITGKDNLLVHYEAVQSAYVGDSANTTYCFVVNGPVDRLFNTGFMIDPSVENF
jgi:hypothetical protein